MRLLGSIFLPIFLVLVVGLSIWVNLGGENIEPVEEAVVEVAEVPVNNESALVADAVVQEETFEVEPAIASGAYTLSGDRIQGTKVDKRWPIASITKLISSFVGQRFMNATDIVTLDKIAVETEGDAGGFSAGENFTVSDLIKAMLITSSNDAAVALASHYGNEAFVLQMNSVAQAAGAEDTQFVEASGLSVRNQSTIEDLVRIAEYIWREERTLFAMTQKSTDFIIDTNTGLARQLININQFAGRNDFLGGKTGTLPEADSNLISVFRVLGQTEPVVVVILGSHDRFGETEEILSGL